MSARGSVRSLGIALVATTLVAAGESTAATVLYVDAARPAGGDGASWATAYRDLQDALGAAAAGDAIWIAQGTYRPDRGTGWRHLSFELPSGVALLGGFAGSESDPSERDIEAHPTILSGDLAGNDGAGMRGDNSYHVATALFLAEPVVLDGLTISGGNANGSAWYSRGGGLVSYVSEISGIDLRLIDNRAAVSGGGAWISGGALTMVRGGVTASDAANGAGIDASGAELSFTAAKLSSNGTAATNVGGAIRASGCTLMLGAVEVRDNVAKLTGAGIEASNSAISMIQSILEGNELTTTGGANGIAVNSVSNGPDFVMSGCTVRENVAPLATASVTIRAAASDPPNPSDPVSIACFGGLFEGNAGSGFGATGGTLGSVEVRDAIFTGQGSTGFGASGASITVSGLLLDGNATAGSLNGAGTIEDCQVLNHSAGGLRLVTGPWSVRDSVFIANIGSSAGQPQTSAGGLAFDAQSSGAAVSIDDCLFQLNGGRALGSNGTTIVRDCLFEGNGSTTSGGAVTVVSAGSLIARSVFRENAASWGSAVSLSFSGPPHRIDSCAFLGNTSGGNQWGGTISVESADLDLVNSLVAGNVGQNFGAGVFAREVGSSVAISNSTIAHNESLLNGDGVYLYQAQGSVTNSIVWGNGTGTQANQLFATAGGFVTVASSAIEGWSGSLGGIGNNGLDPLFIDPDGADGVLGTEDDDYRLLLGSPARDSGNAALLLVDLADLDGDGDTSEPLPLDLGGDARVIGLLDRGCFEYAAAVGSSRRQRASTAPTAPPSETAHD